MSEKSYSDVEKEIKPPLIYGKSNHDCRYVHS